MQAKNNKAFSLIEMMVTISIFAVIGVLVTTSMALTLRSSKKSDSLVRVRESLNYSLASLERQIRNSEKLHQLVPFLVQHHLQFHTFQ